MTDIWNYDTEKRVWAYVPSSEKCWSIFIYLLPDYQYELFYDTTQGKTVTILRGSRTELSPFLRSPCTT